MQFWKVDFFPCSHGVDWISLALASLNSGHWHISQFSHNAAILGTSYIAIRASTWVQHRTARPAVRVLSLFSWEVPEGRRCNTFLQSTVQHVKLSSVVVLLQFD